MKKNNLSAMNRQGGASALVILIMVLFFGSLLTLAIKIGPAYMDDFTIQEAVQGLDGTEGLSRMGPAQIIGLINKRLSVNSIRSFDTKNISVEKNGEIVVLNVDYEVRSNIFRNIDAVVHFQHRHELRGK